MFTGIVRERGRIVSFDDSRLVVAATTEAEIGDSVAIAGVCLTVVERGAGTLMFDVVGETMQRTTLGRLRAKAEGLTWFDAPGKIVRYCVVKGSIAVDGTSLTIAALDDDGFAVALVPHTLEATTLGALQPGDGVNLEADVLAKYVERLTVRP